MPETPEAAVRFVDREQGIITGLIVPFTGPIQGDKDLYGTRFSAGTDLALDWFPEGGRPGLYRHGFDEELEAEVIGRETRNYVDDKGVWMEAQLDLAHRYADEILELVDKGALALSSGSVERLVKINSATRDVERWPWIEWSLVPDPGNPEALVYGVRSVADRPEVALRIAEEVLQVENTPEPSTEPEQAPPDPIEGVRALVKDLQPEHLHDLAVEMGARCANVPPVEEPQPEPTVAITAPAEPVRELDDDTRAELRALAIDTATRFIHK